MKSAGKLVPILVFAGLVVWVFGNALTPPANQMILGDDIHRQYYFFRQFFNTWIGKGIFPWWNPYIFGGEPFIANPIVNIWYPPNWLFTVLPLNIAYSWHLALHVFWAALGMYVLMRTVLNRPEASRNGPDFPSLTSGIVFGLSGFFMARTFAGHVDVIAAASWMPWVVRAFYEVIITTGDEYFLAPLLARLSVFGSARHVTSAKKSSGSGLGKRSSENASPVDRKMIIASAVFAFQLLAGYQTMAFFTLIVVGIMTVTYSLLTRRLGPIIRTGITMVCGVGLAAIQILPVQEFFRLSIRTYRFPYSWHSYGAIEWRSLVQLFDPFRFGTQYTYTGPPPNFIEHSMFTGTWALILAAVGAIYVLMGMVRYAYKKSPSPVFVAAAGFVLVFVYGVWVSLGPNAPIDLQYVLWKSVPMYRYLRIPSRHVLLIVFAVSGLAGIGLDWVTRRLPWVLRLIVGGVVAGLVVVQMAGFGARFISLGSVPETRHDAGLIETFRSDGQPYRTLQNFGVWLPQRDLFDFDSAVSYGVYSATGYDPSILRSYYEYVAQSTGTSGEQAVVRQDVQVPYVGPKSGAALDRLNVKYLMVPSAYDPFAGNPERYRKRIDDAGTEYRVYENLTVLPRYYLADPSCGTVQVTSYTPNRVQLAVQNSCSTTLLTGEVWYPGWIAKVDGKKVRIDKADNVFRTLFVPSGNHRVEFIYEPWIFLYGGGISILMGIFLFGAWRNKTIAG